MICLIWGVDLHTSVPPTTHPSSTHTHTHTHPTPTIVLSHQDTVCWNTPLFFELIPQIRMKNIMKPLPLLSPPLRQTHSSFEELFIIQIFSSALMTKSKRKGLEGLLLSNVLTFFSVLFFGGRRGFNCEFKNLNDVLKFVSVQNGRFSARVKLLGTIKRCSLL